MDKRSTLTALVALGLLVVFGAGVAGAQEAGNGPDGAEKLAGVSPDTLLVDLGNERCPIMNKAVSGKNWSEWNGLRIGNCCQPCVGKLLEDPEKRLDEAGVKWRELAALVAKANASKGAERERILVEISKRHEIVRNPRPARKAIYADLGNPQCPVMGGKVDGKTFSYWNGLRIGHCCSGCKGRLLENPAQVLDEKGIEWRETARSVALAAAAEGEAREKRIAALEKERVVEEREAPPVIDLGNDRCPVMGGKVDGRTYSVWNSLRIGHCCPGCIKTFLKDPEKTLDAKKIEWREAAALIAKIENAPDADRAKLTAEAKRRFTLVDEE